MQMHEAQCMVSKCSSRQLFDWGVGGNKHQNPKRGVEFQRSLCLLEPECEPTNKHPVPAMPRSVGNIQIGSLLCFPAFLNYLMSISFS